VPLKCHNTADVNCILALLELPVQVQLVHWQVFEAGNLNPAVHLQISPACHLQRCAAAQAPTTDDYNITSNKPSCCSGFHYNLSIYC